MLFLPFLSFPSGDGSGGDTAPSARDPNSKCRVSVGSAAATVAVVMLLSPFCVMREAESDSPTDRPTDGGRWKNREITINEAAAAATDISCRKNTGGKLDAYLSLCPGKVGSERAALTRISQN